MPGPWAPAPRSMAEGRLRLQLRPPAAGGGEIPCHRAGAMQQRGWHQSCPTPNTCPPPAPNTCPPPAPCAPPASTCPAIGILPAHVGVVPQQHPGRLKVAQRHGQLQGRAAPWVDQLDIVLNGNRRVNSCTPPTPQWAKLGPQLYHCRSGGLGPTHHPGLWPLCWGWKLLGLYG